MPDSCLRGRAQARVLTAVMGVMLALAGAPSVVNASNPVLAIVDGDTLRRSDFQLELAIQGSYEVTPENIQPLLETWTDGDLLYQEARRRGLGTDETTRVLSEEAAKDYIVSLMSKRLMDTVRVSENEIYDYYNRRKLDFVTQLRFQYIVLKDEKTARQVLADLRKPGAGFKELAEKYSLERSVNPSAELTLVGRNDTTAGLDPILDDTIFTLPMGKPSQPIRNGGQYWVVDVIERIRLRGPLPLDTARTYISQFLELKRKRARLQEVIAGLKKKSKVVLNPPHGDTSGFLASVGDMKLTRHRLELQLQPGQSLTPDDVPRVVEVWVNSELLYQDAKKLGVGTDETTRVLLNNRNREYVANLLIEKLTRDIVVSSNDVFDYFQKHREDFLYDVRILYVLSGSDSAARRVLTDAQKGADFQMLARERSVDRALTQGAESRFIDRLEGQSRLSPELEEAVFSLKQGELSPVIHTNQGYWVIKVTDRKQVRNDIKFDDAKERISAFLRQQRYRQAIENLLAELSRTNPPKLLPSNYWID